MSVYLLYFLLLVWPPTSIFIICWQYIRYSSIQKDIKPVLTRIETLKQKREQLIKSQPLKQLSMTQKIDLWLETGKE